MSDESRVSSGGFSVPRFRLEVFEQVEFLPEVSRQINVGPVINMIAAMEVNPCAECTTILDLVRILASRSGIEPEEMGKIDIQCRPDMVDSEFYQVLGQLPDGTSQILTSVRCQLVSWMLNNLSLNQDK